MGSRRHHSIEIVEDKFLAVDVDEDQQVIKEAINAVKTVFMQMKQSRGKGYQPTESRLSWTSLAQR
jgi:hypothetical protein